MCGILFRKSLKNSKKNSFRTSLELMQHRGPNNTSIYSNNNVLLGHTRLSIIDLDKSSNQPFISECKRYVLIFNGEIYNFIELRRELIKKGFSFKTNSDTEVILKSFINHGIDCVKNFNGMFSFIIYDNLTEDIFFARDRFGIKPLFYFKTEEEIIFSSEINPIINLIDDYSLNKTSILSFFYFRQPLLNKTFFNEINKIPAASYGHIKSFNISIKKYWCLEETFKSKTLNFSADKIYGLLNNSVNLRTRSDVPVCSFLSGGLDSSIISYLLSVNNNKRINTFSIGFEDNGYNESNFSNLMASFINSEHHTYIFSKINYFKDFDKLIKTKGAPLSVPNEVPLSFLSSELKKNSTVVLSGEGADEIFAGYGRIFSSSNDYNKFKVGHSSEIFNNEFLNNNNNIESEFDHFINNYFYISPNKLDDIFISNKDFIENKSEIINTQKSLFESNKDLSYDDKSLLFFQSYHLSGLLDRLDSSTMYNSIEGRVPFLDHNLVEYVNSIPFSDKIKWKKNGENLSKDMISKQYSEVNDITKFPLRASFQDKIPVPILKRTKVGFPVPLDNWDENILNLKIDEFVESKMIRNLKIFNLKAIQNLKRKKEPMLKWMLHSLKTFLEIYYEKEN